MQTPRDSLSCPKTFQFSVPLAIPLSSNNRRVAVLAIIIYFVPLSAALPDTDLLTVLALSVSLPFHFLAFATFSSMSSTRPCKLRMRKAA